MKLFIDFETRSRVDLAKAGNSVYARDLSTDVFCMAYAKAIGVGWQQDLAHLLYCWTPETADPSELAELFDLIEQGAEIHAHNAAFEWSIWEHIMVPRYGWPRVKPEQWRCTMARCALAGLPLSLDQAAKALGLEGKDKDGSRIMQKYCKPRKPSKHNPKEWFDDPEELQKLYDYCVQDVRVEMAIHHATPEPPEYEKTLWTLDQIINRRGVGIDRRLAKAAIAMRESYAEQLKTLLYQLTGCTPSQVAKLTKWLQDSGVNIGDLTKPSVESHLANPGLPADCRKVLEIRQSLSNASLKKYDAMLKGLDSDDRIRFIHQYAGAGRTGRWAGRRIQPQNFPRGAQIDKLAKIMLRQYPEDQQTEALELHLREIVTEQLIDFAYECDIAALEAIGGTVPETLVALLRPTIAAPPGRKLIVCDFAAIEARVLAWLAGQEDVLQQFRDGKDVYKELAGKIYNKPGDAVEKPERFVGKVAVLGLGYGMGAAKFYDTCAAFGQKIETAFAEKVVEVYRETNFKIKRLWYDLDDAVVRAIEGRPSTVRGLLIDCHERWLRIKLPSGRRLHYFDPRLEDGAWPSGDPKKEIGYAGTNQQNQWVRLRTYGGKLVENCVQAIARDLLANALKNLTAAGYDVVMHVHDEAVVECDPHFGSVAAVERIMCELPAWADGCPVEAEGFVTRRYRK